jgi:ornithine carbamoyltransferase
MAKDFLTLADWRAEELLSLLDRARDLKELRRQSKGHQTLPGRVLAMFFEKPSLRTHVTFEAGMTQLGGHAILLRPEQVGIGTRESPRDVANNLSCWVDGIVARTFSHELVEELARVAQIPVINGLTDLLHPCQVMADLQTISEKCDLKSAVIAYLGDGNNMANSLILGAAVLGIKLRLATPQSHRPDESIWRRGEELAARSGAKISWVEDPAVAVRGARFVYTDTWASMGQEDERESRKKIFERYQLNADLLAQSDDAYAMHCLPAHRGEEITDEVLDGDRSLALVQAENRLHAQKAVLERLLGSSC